jgi:transcriptional regulator with XRE-family HTH domain
VARRAERLEALFPRRLAELRKSAGLSQAELAERIELSTEFVSRMERGKALPSLPTFVRLVHELHCSADELLHDPATTSEEAARRLLRRLLVASDDVRSRAMFVAESVLEYETTQRRSKPKREP